MPFKGEILRPHGGTGRHIQHPPANVQRLRLMLYRRPDQLPPTPAITPATDGTAPRWGWCPTAPESAPRMPIPSPHLANVLKFLLHFAIRTGKSFQFNSYRLLYGCTDVVLDSAFFPVSIRRFSIRRYGLKKFSATDCTVIFNLHRG